jgi:hypothetical protein
MSVVIRAAEYLITRRDSWLPTVCHFAGPFHRSVMCVCVCVCVFAPYHTISITIHASQPLPFIHARHTPAPCIPASTIPGSSPISPANNHTSRGAEAENHGPHLVSSRCATSGRGCHYASNMRATSALDCTFVSSNLAGYSNPVQQATRHAAL